MIETNVDNMNPEIYGYLADQLFARGALDVTLTPTIMKKGRPAVTLAVLAHPHAVDGIVETIFRETTSIGLRMVDVRRRKLRRREETVETRYGPVRVKVSLLEGSVANVAPEYEDCRALASTRGVPLKRIYEEAALAAKAGIRDDG